MARAIGLLGDLLVLSMLVASAGDGTSSDMLHRHDGGRFRRRRQLLRRPDRGWRADSSSRRGQRASPAPPCRRVGSVHLGSGEATSLWAVAAVTVDAAHRPDGCQLRAGTLAGVRGHVRRRWRVPARRASATSDDRRRPTRRFFNDAALGHLQHRRTTGRRCAPESRIGGPLRRRPRGFACGNATCLGEPHRYRIDWTATEIDFFIDGTPSPTPRRRDHGQHAASRQRRGAPATRVALRGLAPDDALRHAVCRSSPALFDGGNAGADWTTFTATHSAAERSGRRGRDPHRQHLRSTGLVGLRAAAGGTTIQSPKGRYLQYRVTLSTTAASADARARRRRGLLHALHDRTRRSATAWTTTATARRRDFPDLGAACTVAPGDCQATGTASAGRSH